MHPLARVAHHQIVMPDSSLSYFWGGSEDDILQIAKACDLTIRESETDGFWHTLHISSGRKVLEYSNRVSAISDLCTYPAIRKFLVDTWRRHNNQTEATASK